MRASTLIATLVLLIASTNLYSYRVEADEQINIWYANGVLNDVLSELAQQYTNQYPNISVKLVGLPYEELKTSMVRAVQKNVAPDIAILTSENTAYSKILKLSALTSFENPRVFIEPSRKASNQQQTVYGLPLQTNNRLLMFYNKALVNEPANNWEQLYTQAPDLIQNKILPLGLVFNEPYWFTHFTTLFTTQLTNTNQAQLNTLEMAASLAFYQQLEQAAIIRANCSYDCVSKDFYAGKVAYALNGVWAITEASNALGENFGITTLPSLDGTPMKALVSDNLLTFPNDAWNGPKRKSIRALVGFLQSKYSQMQIANATKMLPINLEWLSEQNRSPFHSAQIDLMHEVTYMPKTLRFVSIWNGIRKGVLLHSHANLSAQEAAEFMQYTAQINQQGLESLGNKNYQ